MNKNFKLDVMVICMTLLSIILFGGGILMESRIIGGLLMFVGFMIPMFSIGVMSEVEAE